MIDHSVQLDEAGTPNALDANLKKEFERNQERYTFLRWGQGAFKKLRIVPPGLGICHQINLEYLAKCVMTRKDESGRTFAFPDTLVGTDSHTTMINGLGVFGWGVGGIEAEAAMLGQPIPVLTPVVIGVRLSGGLKEGVTATDLALTVTQLLRKKGVVEQFVEFFGPGLDHLTLADRATVANMAPEYGATMGLFPIDAETLRYLRETGRTEQEVELVERYCRAQGMFRTPESPEPIFSEVLSLDLASVEPSISGPKRPHDRMHVKDVKNIFRRSLTAPIKDRGYGLSESEATKTVAVPDHGTLSNGSVVIASITSCTNTSNPHVLLAAGLIAKKAVEKGLSVAPIREDQPRAGLARGHRLSQALRRVGASRETRLRRRGVWLRNVHRQQRPARSGRRNGDQGRQARRRRGAERQPEFRRARPPADEGQLPLFAAARRGVRAGRNRGHRPDERAARQGPTAASPFF